MKIKSLRLYSPIVICFLAFSAGSLAQDKQASDDQKNSPPASEGKIAIKSVKTNKPKDDEGIIRFNQPIKVEGDFAELRKKLKTAGKESDLNAVKILLAGNEVKTRPIWTGENEIVFHWDDRAEAQKEIRALRARLLVDGDREAESVVQFKLAYGTEIWELPSKIKIWIYEEERLYWCAGLLAVTIVLFGWLAKTSDIIRDTTPPNPPAKTQRPYSLAKLQMALWFFAVIGSFLWLWVITTDIPAISSSALILMGLSVGTGALAVVVDSNKQQTADNELSALIPERDKLAATVAELQKVYELKIKAAQKQNFITTTEAKVALLNDRINAAPGNVADQAELTRLLPDAANGRIELKEISDQIAELQPVDDGAVTGDTTGLTGIGNLKIRIAENKAKLEQTEKQIASAVSAQTKPVSQGFRKDILTDMNGISFHRFQMLWWTLVLIAVFLDKVWSTFAMPVFDDLLLTLTGISGVTYIGFKVPERQS